LYFRINFDVHLCEAITGAVAQNFSNDHPAVEILHDLETVTYYVDENLSGDSDILVHHIIHSILEWENMLRVGAS
jgi:hypothetical protein